MPSFKDLIGNPDYQSLPESDQYDIRKRFFHKHVAKSSDYLALPSVDRHEIANKVLFPAQKPAISQQEFEESRGLPPGYSGGAETRPLANSPALFLSPTTLFGGASLIGQAVRGATTMGTAGAVGAIEEGRPRDIVKEAKSGALFGAVAGPATSLAVRGIARGAHAVRDLFRSKAVPGSIADAPAGLADEVFLPAVRGEQRTVIPDEILDPSFPSIIPMGPPRQRMLPEWNPPPPAIAGAARPTEFGLPPLPPVNRAIQSTPIRLGPPRVEALPPGGTGDIVSILQKRFRGNIPPNAEEMGLLRGIYNDDEAARELLRNQPIPIELRKAAGDILERHRLHRPPPGVIPLAPPSAPPMAKAVGEPLPDLLAQLPKPKGFQMDETNIWSHIREITGGKGIRFGKDLGSDRAALLKNSKEARSLVRSMNNKNAMGADEVATELFERGMIDDATEAALLDKLRGAKGAVRVSPKELEIDQVVSDIEGETQRGNLIALMDQYAPDHPIFRAAERRLKVIDPKVQMGARLDEIDDGPMKDVLANFGPGPYTAKQLENAEKLANQMQRKGLLKVHTSPKEAPEVSEEVMRRGKEFLGEPISFQKTPAGEQGMIPGTEGRAVPSSGLLPRGKQAESLTPLERAGVPEQQMPLPRTPTAAQWLAKPVDPISLKAYTEGDLNDLAAQAYQSGKTSHVRAIEQEFAERMQGFRPSNPDPLDDLAKAEKQNLIAKILKNEEGQIWIGQDPKATSVEKDMNGFFDRWQDVATSFKDNELRRGASAFIRRMTSAQELARQHPEFAPIYEPFHAYPRQAVNRHVDAIKPLFPEGGGNYFDLPDPKRSAVDKMLLMHKTQRQGQARYTPQELAARGFDQSQIKAFSDVLDYGKNILNAHRQHFIESRLPAMIERGTPELIARQELEAKAAQALQGLDHWVPHYRAGDKTVTVKDSAGKVVEFRLEPNVRGRVDSVRELQAKYPKADGFRIEEGQLDRFVQSKAFDEIDLASLEVLSRFAKVDPAVAQEFIGQLRPALQGRSDALSRFKHMDNIPGFKQDLREGLIQSGNSAFHYIERQKALRQATDALSQINEHEKPELFKFASRFIEDNIKPGEKRLQGVRDALYAYLLGGNIKQYAVQLTQFPTVVAPRMLKFGSPGEVASASGTAARWAFARDLTKAPAELQAAWREGYKHGVFQPRAEMFVGNAIEKLPWLEAKIETRMADQLSQFLSPEVRGLKKARDYWMLPLTDADMRTRLGGFTGFYQLGRKTMQPDEAIQFAIKETNRTNYLYGRAENPELFGRGHIAQFANMLKTWPANYVSFLSGVYRDAAKEAAERGVSITRTADFKTLAASAGAMLALGGVLHNVPGVARSALNGAFGIDLETEARKVLSGKLDLPDPIVDLTLRGAGTLAGVDISRSIAIGDVVPQSITELLGPVPSVATSVGTGLGQLAQSQTQPFGPSPLDALEVLSGGGFKNMIKALRLMQDQGIATKRGGQLPGTEGLREVDPYLQGLGFTPLSVTNAKSLQRITEGEIQAHKTQQSEVYERLGRAILKQDQSSIESIMKKIDEVNQKAIASGRIDQMITIDRGQLKQRIAEMVSPEAKMKRVPKRARERAMELQRLYAPPE